MDVNVQSSDKGVQSQEDDPFTEDDAPLSQSILKSSRRELFLEQKEEKRTSTSKAQILADFDETSASDEEFLPLTQMPGQKTPPR